jgi:Acyl-CoA dehydrogenase, C-terminal domain
MYICGGFNWPGPPRPGAGIPARWRAGPGWLMTAGALDLTVEYALTRVQFGQVIGGFQALRHRLANLHVLVESARSLSRAAAAAAGGATAAGLGPRAAAGLGLRAAAVKVYCSDVLTQTAGEMIQLHLTNGGKRSTLNPPAPVSPRGEHEHRASGRWRPDRAIVRRREHVRRHRVQGVKSAAGQMCPGSYWTLVHKCPTVLS